MSENGATGSLGKWSTPECPFLIEYDTRVLDDIRLAVVDAFYSLPRGGAEIGGILLGAHSEDRVVIDAYLPLDCEHAYGPSFTLSPKDLARLLELIASTPGGGSDVVGWYHSHTRSDVFLSDADVDLHNRCFRDPRHIALVMKPSTFDPVRCGFFFRGAGGAIRAESSWREFTLAPAVARPAPAQPEISEAPAAPRSGGAARRPVLTLDAVLKAASASSVIEVSPAAAVSIPTAEPLASPAAASTAAPPPALPPEPAPSAAAAAESNEPEPAAAGPSPPPDPAPARRSFAGLYWLAIAGLVGMLAYQTRDWWMGPAGRAPAPSAAAPKAGPEAARTAPVAPPSIGLALSDSAGSLQVRWDASAQAVRSASRGTIEVNDGKDKAVVPLDRVRLSAGNFIYARQTESVDVRLVLELGDGGRLQEVASFLGKLPERPAEEPEVRMERDGLVQEAAKLKADLKAQTERARRLERSIDDMRKQLKRDQQRRRLENQASDTPR